mmetsp:Transcript_3669/g.7943  ORF Transcript_3669/g.7943 Transcript_3669/m.7943 type:complete len:86 (-) Transcript_3669:805-1062(-)
MKVATIPPLVILPGRSFFHQSFLNHTQPSQSTLTKRWSLSIKRQMQSPPACPTASPLSPNCTSMLAPDGRRRSAPPSDPPAAAVP